MLIADADEQVRGVAHPAVVDVAIVVAVGPVDQTIACGRFQAFEVLAGDEVDHAADRVGAVGRRGAVLQHLDPADRGHRDEVGVGRPAREALTIDQDQGSGGAQTADVDRAAAATALRARRELVGITQSRADDRQRLDQLDHVRRAALLNLFLIEHGDRNCGVLGRAGDERAGDDHLADFVSARGCGGRSRGGARVGGAQTHGDRQSRGGAKMPCVHVHPPAT